MNYPNVIGRFFAEEWQSALKNEGVFYTPIPSIDMSLDQLNAIKYTLQNLVEYWTNQADPSVNTASEAQANAQAIADLESQKLGAVNSVIQLKLSAASGGDGSDVVLNPTDQIDQSGGETSGSGSTWIWILGIGAAAWFLFGKKPTRKNQVAKRKPKR